MTAPARPEPAGQRPELAGLQIGGPPEPWRELGFAVDGDRLTVGGIGVELGHVGAGVVGWTLRHVRSGGDLDGLPTTVSTSGAPPPVTHPNGAVAVDHVVITTGDFDRTAAVMDARGLALRRIREAGGHRQGFRRLGPAIMEIVETPGQPGGARFWGLVIVVADLEALRQRLAPHLGAARPAVQPGRHIATLSAGAGPGLRLAFMDPEPSRPTG